MLLSGELSMTSSCEELLELLFDPEVVELEPEEHAAIPATRKPAAETASTRLLVSDLIVLIDFLFDFLSRFPLLVLASSAPRCLVIER
jgi:hypothetical protein